MEDLIRQAFLHVDIIGPHVAEGHYDLLGPNGDIILPRVWETVVEPDWTITMHMWPMPEPPKPEEPVALPMVDIIEVIPPPPGPPAAEEPKKAGRSKRGKKPQSKAHAPPPAPAPPPSMVEVIDDPMIAPPPLPSLSAQLAGGISPVTSNASSGKRKPKYSFFAPRPKPKPKKA